MQTLQNSQESQYLVLKEFLLNVKWTFDDTNFFLSGSSIIQFIESHPIELISNFLDIKLKSNIKIKIKMY